MALQPCRTTLARSSRSCLRAVSSSPACQLRSLATDAAAPESTTTTPKVPRWKETPAAMKAPVRMDWAKKAKNKIWAVNNNPAFLDDMYDRLLGASGHKMLPEELKWQAVTHKSFDQGRRGFNDKLALMGRLTLIMEATKQIVSKDPLPGSRQEDEFGREPFQNEQLQQVDNLLVELPVGIMPKEGLYGLAKSTGLINVVRWKPRLPENLESSGIEAVMSSAIFAVVGAITLQHGAAVGAQIARERILARIPKSE